MKVPPDKAAKIESTRGLVSARSIPMIPPIGDISANKMINTKI